MSDALTKHFDNTDPIFVSYRQADGTEIAAELTWLLRAAGLPVWRDVDDLPPGDTPTRLREAIADGLSGAVLIITPGVADSPIVKKIESVELIRLHQTLAPFGLAIANSITSDSGSPDYSAPDRLLESIPGTLSGVDQHGSSRPELVKIVRLLLWQRIKNERERVAAEGRVMTLSIQSRNTPQVFDRTGASIDIRMRRSTHERLPGRDGLQDLKDTLGFLPDAVTRAKARTVRISGGAHLSIAVALGAALPATRIGSLEIEDQQGVVWASGGPSGKHSGYLSLQASEQKVAQGHGQKSVAIFVDLVPSPSDAAFDRFLEDQAGSLDAWQHFRGTQNEHLDPGQAGAIAAAVVDNIRELSNGNENARVHLLLRVPFPIAVLIGHLTNTLNLRLYEWDNTTPPAGEEDFRARFVACIDVAASHPAGAIVQVVLPAVES